MLHDSAHSKKADEALKKQAKPRERAEDHGKGRESSEKRQLDENGPQWKTKKKAKPGVRKPPKPSPDTASGPIAKQTAGRPEFREHSSQSLGIAGIPPGCNQPASREATPQPPAKSSEVRFVVQSNEFGRSEQMSRDEYPSEMPECLRKELTRVDKGKLVISTERLVLGSSVAIGERILFPLLEDLHVGSRGKTFTLNTGLHVGR